jgi:hypothetical protein
VQYSGNVDSIGQGSAGYQARKSGLYVEATGFGVAEGGLKRAVRCAGPNCLEFCATQS